MSLTPEFAARIGRPTARRVDVSVFPLLRGHLSLLMGNNVESLAG